MDEARDGQSDRPWASIASVVAIVLGFAFWFWWGCMPYSELASQRVAHHYHFLGLGQIEGDSVDLVARVNLVEATVHGPTAYVVMVGKLLVCLALPVIVLGWLKGRLVATVLSVGCVAAMGYALVNAVDWGIAGWKYGWSVFSHRPDGIVDLLLALVKLVALVVSAIAIIYGFLVGFVVMLLGTTGNEITILCAEAIALTGLSPLTATYIGSPLVGLLALVGFAAQD